MALFKIFKGGNSARLTDAKNANYMPIVDGYCYFDTETGLFYIDSVSGTEKKRAPINAYKAIADIDGKQIDTTYLKKSIGSAKGDILYWSAANTPTRLAAGTNGQFLKLVNGVPTWAADNNTDTGATAVEVSGSGNAITAASYDEATRTLTLTKGAIYNNYSLPIATTSALGGVKSTTTGTTENRDYAVEVKTDGTMKVNVPWTDHTYTLAGLMGSTAIGKATLPVYWDGSKFATITSYEGNAATASKLETARSLKTNLGSTTDATFDGSANQDNIPIIGTLGTANGGTGNTTFTTNCLVWTESATKMTAGYHYANRTKVAINSTTEPTENFYVKGTVRFGIGSSDKALNKRFIIGSSGNRYLSFGAAGVQAYDADDAVSTLFLNYSGGSMSVGTSSNTVTSTMYGSLELPTANGFNYSGIGAASDNIARHVWFSYNGVKGRPVYSDKFKYNPSTDILTVGSISGNAATATKVKNKLTIAGKEYDGSAAVSVSLTDLGLSRAMRFIGTTESLADGSTGTPTIASGQTGYAAANRTAGDVVLNTTNNYEYLWTGSAWQVLGPGGSYDVAGTAAGLVNALDVASVGGAGKYISAISETDGKISATASNLSDIAAAASTTLEWNTEKTIATIGGNDIKVKLPANPNTNTTYTIASGDANGQIKVTPSSGSAYNVSVAGLGSNAYTSTAYLPLSGGTMTGNISYNMNSSTQIPFKVYGGNADGQGISIGAGGATIVGSGESAKACEALLGATTEQLWLASDGDIHFYTNCQTIGNKVGVILNTSRAFYPNTNNTGSLGTSSYKWANAYATTFHGALDGKATTAGTADQTKATLTVSNNAATVASKTFNGSSAITVTGDDLFKLFSTTKSITVTRTWQDTGIKGEDLETGSYIIQAYVNSPGTGTLSSYREYYTGIMSWFSTATDNSDYDEILLHKAGHASSGHNIYLRTIRSPGGSDQSGRLKLQIAADIDTTVAASIVFKFRKMI